MTPAKRVLAAIALATGASALAAPAANAASPELPVGTLSVMDTVDTVTESSVAPEHREQVPSASQQLAGLNRLAEVPNDLDPLTGQAAPVTGLLGA